MRVATPEEIGDVYNTLAEVTCGVAQASWFVLRLRHPEFVSGFQTYPNPPLQREGIKKSRHAELDSASQPLPKFIKLLLTFTNRATCVAPLSRPSGHPLLGCSRKTAIPHFAAKPLALCKNAPASARNPLPKVEGRKCAFTLAETLITLGIIGVVAAITIPTLISNYKKHVVENQLKTAYSIIAQAINASEAVNGSFENWDFSESADLDKYIFSYLKTSKNCGKRGKGCFKTIPEVNNIDGWYSLDGTYHRGSSEVPSNFSKVILSNGMSLAVMTSGNHIYRFVIDINGPQKGESIMGKDIFKITLADGVTGREASGWSTDKGLRPGAECADGSTHKRATIDKLLNDPSCRGGCNKMATSANSRSPGEACSAVIMKNGWKIPDNYPIKF